MNLDAPLTALSSEIGRGHPAYLDSVLVAYARLRAADARLPEPQVLALPAICSGIEARTWRLVESAYRFGSRGGVATWLYHRLRRPDARPSRADLNLLGAGLRERFAGYSGVCLVDHPLLAWILRGTCRVAYLHAEIAAPGSAAVPGCARVYVPLAATADRLAAAGVEREALRVTGLVIEPELLDRAESAFAARIERLAGTGPLTIGFFTSGARPRPHLELTFAGIRSCLVAGQRPVLFWGTGLIAAAEARLALRQRGIADDAVEVGWGRTRRDETSRTAERFPGLDVMIAAAHERTGWACGLGIPFFPLCPCIGPCANENLDFAVRLGVADPISDLAAAAAIGERLAALRADGRLFQMARAGRGLPTAGAETIARDLTTLVA